MELAVMAVCLVLMWLIGGWTAVLSAAVGCLVVVAVGVLTADA